MLQLSGGEQDVATEAGAAMDQELDFSIDVREFKLPPPKALEEQDRNALIRSSLTRIWDGVKDFTTPDLDFPESPGFSASDMWMLLLVRLVTRVADPPISADEETEESKEANALAVSDLYDRQDRLRQTLCDYIMADFPGR